MVDFSLLRSNFSLLASRFSLAMFLFLKRNLDY